MLSRASTKFVLILLGVCGNRASSCFGRCLCNACQRLFVRRCCISVRCRLLRLVFHACRQHLRLVSCLFVYSCMGDIVYVCTLFKTMGWGLGQNHLLGIARTCCFFLLWSGFVFISTALHSVVFPIVVRKAAQTCLALTSEFGTRFGCLWIPVTTGEKRFAARVSLMSRWLACIPHCFAHFPQSVPVRRQLTKAVGLGVIFVQSIRFLLQSLTIVCENNGICFRG